MWILIALLVAQFAVSTTLSVVNVRHLRWVAASPPEGWAERLDVSQFPRMTAYAEAHSRLGHLARAADLGVTLAILLSGLLSATTRWVASLAVGPVWQGLLVLAVPAAISYLAALPWDLASSFGVERRFGFSTITVKTWLMDQVKTMALSLVLGLLLGGGLLFLIGRLGGRWWLPAWVGLSLFQLLMTFIAPVFILPLFNKFEPLRDPELGAQIGALAREARFPLGGVYQVDASLRSTHSNAYFTGLGRTRRTALFDTLLDQHTHPEILAILAHEIGHWKKLHVIQGIVAGIVTAGVGTALVAATLDAPWLYKWIGVGDLYLERGTSGPVAAVGLYLVGILLSPLGLLLSPIASWFSRRHEYQADAYSLALYPHPAALEEALIKLSEKNLSNLFPHPWVVAFRYSHPPLLERIAAIRGQRPAGPAGG